MPRTTHDVYGEWKYRGRRVGYVRSGLYHIDRTIAGRRARISTGCITLEAANAEYERFEVNPTAYVTRGGKRAFGRRARRADPARGAQLADAHLARAYRISPADHRALLVAQEDRCAICRGHRSDVGELEVDHDHVTGRVRGLLCGPCNRGIGQLGDDPARLRAALAYLEAEAPPSAA